MSRRAQKETVGVALFPFLAVLICTMGSLIVLLVMIVQDARDDVDRSVATATPDVTPTSAKPSGPSKEELEKAQEAADDAHWRKEVLVQQRTEKSEELAQKRLALSHLEDHIRRIEKQAQILVDRIRELDDGKKLKDDEVKSTKEALEELKRKIDEKKKELEAEKKKSTEEQWFALIPYDGPNGTRRRPFYIECVEEGIVIQPEGLLLTPNDFNGPLGPGNPLDAALRAKREYVQQATNGKGGEPYPLLIVRPSGVLAYSAARAAMKAWDEEFGYELIAEEKRLDFGPRDPELDKMLTQTVSVARKRQAMLAAAMPRRYQEDEPTSSFNPQESSNYDPASSGSASPGVGAGGGTGGSFGAGTAGTSSAPKNTGIGTGGAANNTSTGLAGGTGSGGLQPSGSSGAIGATAGQPGSRGGLSLGAAAGSPGGAAGSGSPGTPSSGTAGGANGPAGSGQGGSTAGSGSGSGGGTGSNPAGGIAGGTAASGGTAAGGGGGAGAQAGQTAIGLPTSIGNMANAAAVGGAPPPSGSPTDPQQGEAPKPGMMKSTASQSSSNTTGTRSTFASNSNARPKGSGRTGGASKTNNWGLPDAKNQLTGITRPIRISCQNDRLMILPDKGESRQPVTIPLSPEMSPAELEKFVSGIQRNIKSWGLAVAGGYWKPELNVDVAPNGEARFAELQTALQGSGFDIKRKIR